MMKRNSTGTIVLCLLVLVAVVGLVVHTMQERKAAYEYTDEGMWIVQEGDTLWGIAQAYSNNRHDVRQVVHIIRHECNDDISPTLQIGQTVYVPLFNCMDWEYWEGD